MGRGKTQRHYDKRGSKNASRAADRVSSSYLPICPILRFDRIDRAGKFAFDIKREDFDHILVWGKLMAYSCMTWREIIGQTHGRRDKSKSHYIRNLDGLSAEAKQRLKDNHLEDETDLLFSLAPTGRLRIIGLLADTGEFHILWYDPNHEAYPSGK